ncbi:MAG TPA: hypothetical protein VHL80_10075 [Polyangia bacterium]|nr:hypothetical protein [Polyangia bacterium]
MDGKRFVALRDLPAKCIVILSPRVTDMRDVVLQAGEAFKVVSTHDDMVSCRPLRYAALEDALVTPETRGHAGYKGYGLVIDRAAFDRDCAPHSESTDISADR